MRISANVTAKARDYSLRNWRALTCYLDDGNVPIDNNAADHQADRQLGAPGVSHARRFEHLHGAEHVLAFEGRASAIFTLKLGQRRALVPRLPFPACAIRCARRAGCRPANPMPAGATRPTPR